MTVLTDKQWRSIGSMQPYLLKELAEIYSTPTPKGWPEPKKVIDLYLIDCVLYNSRGLVFIPRA